MFPFDIVVFDLDGTLADTAPDIAAALNYALGMLGRPALPVATVRQLVGEGARMLLRRGLAATGESSEELVGRAYTHFIDHYAAHVCVGTRPYAGVEAALDALATARARLALCTNKPELLTRKLLDALGWTDRFAALIGGDTLPVRKPDPAPLLAAIAAAGGGTAAFVGDSLIDAQTARAASIPFVRVSFGFSDQSSSELGAAAVIDSFNELMPTLSRLFASPSLDPKPKLSSSS